MYIDVRDHLRNSIQVSFSLDSTFGDVRNAVNKSLPAGFLVTEYELVPAPFAHYVDDDPECFKGPADDWLIADVFFDALAAGLRRAEDDEAAEGLLVRLDLRSIAPLGPPRRVGVLFPGDRVLDAAALEQVASTPGGEHAARFFGAASSVRGYDVRAAFSAGGDDRASRDAALLLSLAFMEARLRRPDDGALRSNTPSWGHQPIKKDEIVGVCGFGAAGEAAALVFCGALTLEEGLELGDARAAGLASVGADATAVSVVGGDADGVARAVAAAANAGLGALAVTHDLCATARVRSRGGGTFRGAFERRFVLGRALDILWRPSRPALIHNPRRSLL